MFSGYKPLTGQIEPYGGLTSAHGPHFVQPCSCAYILWAAQCGKSGKCNCLLFVLHH